MDNKNNVVFPGAYISSNANISNSIIMPNASIGDNISLDRSIVGEFAEVTEIQDYDIESSGIKLVPPNYARLQK